MTSPMIPADMGTEMKIVLTSVWKMVVKIVKTNVVWTDVLRSFFFFLFASSFAKLDFGYRRGANSV